MCNWDAGGHEETEEYPPPPHPSDAPAPQNPTYVLVWWSGRSEALGMGRKAIRGGKIPPPLEPAPPLTPIGTPVTPNLPRAGGPGPSGPGPMAARRGPPDPTAEEKLPHPIIQSVPKLHKTIRHPGKAVYPTSIGPPLRRHRCIEDPHTRAGPKRMHQPMLPAAHQPGPKPPRPSRNPNPEAERPQIPKPPPRTNSGTVRPPGWQPTSAGTGIPSSAACRRQRKQHPESPYPIQAKVAAPAPNPPRNPPPGNPPMPPGPYCHPTPTTKTTAGQNRDPHPH